MWLPLRPKKEHKQIVQHIMVMMKMKVENWKRGTYREHERRIKARLYLPPSLSLSPQGFVTWLYQTFDFLKKLKQLLKLRWNVHSFLPVLFLSRPTISYVLPTQLSLSLSLTRHNPPKKKTIYIFHTILYFEHFFQKFWPRSHTILHWFYSKTICINYCKIA